MKLPTAFSPEVMAELAKPVQRVERSAELAPSVTPAWYVIETFPQRERDVANYLIERRFGIFMPEVEETIIRRGRRIDRKALMFTRYLFVFTWLTDHNYSLVQFADGVLGFVAASFGKPAVVSDQEIDILRAVENGKRSFPAIVMEGDASPPARLSRKARRRWRPRTRMIDPVRDIERVRAWSAFEDGFLQLDSEGREQTLRAALGLAPSTHPID